MAENEEKLQQLQLIEQSMTNLLMQKQQFQSKLSETDSALKEIGTKKQVYKIIGNVMVLSDAEAVKKELEENKHVLEIRIRSVEKQEEKIRERAKKMQDDVLKDMGK